MTRCGRIWNVPISGQRIWIGALQTVIWRFAVVFCLDFLCPIWIFGVLFGYFQSFFGDFHPWFASFCAGSSPEARKASRPLEKGAKFYDRTWTDGDPDVPFSGSGTYPSPDRAFGSERSEQSFGDLQSCFLWIFCVLFGFFVSYLDIFGRFLDFLCPIWRFVVAFGDFQSFYGDFVSFSWRKKNTSHVTVLMSGFACCVIIGNSSMY